MKRMNSINRMNRTTIGTILITVASSKFFILDHNKDWTTYLSFWDGNIYVINKFGLSDKV